MDKFDRGVDETRRSMNILSSRTPRSANVSVMNDSSMLSKCCRVWVGVWLKNYGFKCRINISNNLETNLVQGKKNIRDKYILKEEEFFDNYFKKILEKN